MKIKWTKLAEKNLVRIFDHTKENFTEDLAKQVYLQVKSATGRLENFPELGRKIMNISQRRELIVEGNSIIYEIVLSKEPHIVIRNVRPRKTHNPV